MPAKINMFLSNGNFNVNLNVNRSPLSNSLNLAVVPDTKAVTPSINVSASLNSSIISRIHNVRPGCGSCGRK